MLFPHLEVIIILMSVKPTPASTPAVYCAQTLIFKLIFYLSLTKSFQPVFMSILHWTAICFNKNKTGDWFFWKTKSWIWSRSWCLIPLETGKTMCVRSKSDVSDGPLKMYDIVYFDNDEVTGCFTACPLCPGGESRVIRPERWSYVTSKIEFWYEDQRVCQGQIKGGCGAEN